MSYKIYIRPLVENDAETSYRWRNDDEVWKHTGSRPDKEITIKMEREWIQKVLARPDEKRFAICLKETNEYIGNVQLTEINSYEAEFHIFIGEKKFWGKGLGTAATNSAVEYAFKNLNLQCVYLFVKKENIAAIRAYEKAEFKITTPSQSNNIRLAKYSLDSKKNKTVSVFVLAYNHEKFIVQTIEGILLQKTDFDIEIVIGEDCSTDKTRNIILDYAREHPNKFKLILHKKNIGAANNQMFVLNACNGKYIAMCEGDDYWTDPLKLQKQVDFLEANSDFAICFHRAEIIHEDKSQEPYLSNLNQKEITTFEDLAFGNYIITASCVFRNDLFNESLNWLQNSPVGDYSLHLLNARYGKIKFFYEPMTVYRIHTGGMWNVQKEEQKLITLLAVLDYCYQHFYPRGAVNFKKQISLTLAELCFICFREGKYREYRQHFLVFFQRRLNLKMRAFAALAIRYFLSYQKTLANLYKKVSNG